MTTKKEFQPNDRITYSPPGKPIRHGIIANDSMAGLGAFQVWFDGHTVAEVALVEYLTHEQPEKPKVRQFKEAYKITHQSIDELASYLNRGWPECVGERSIQSFLVSFCEDLEEEK
jgi:hypothetical protein